MDTQVCPNCQNKNPVNGTTNRLVTESCGHKKCIECLMSETTGCKACKLEKTKENHEHMIETEESVEVMNVDIHQTKVDDDQTTECNRDHIEESERNETATNIGPETNKTTTNIGPKAVETATNICPKNIETATNMGQKTNEAATNIDPKTNETNTNLGPKTNETTTNFGPKTNETNTNFGPKTNENETATNIGPETEVNMETVNEGTVCPVTLVPKVMYKLEKDEWSTKKMFKPETPHIRVDKDKSGTRYYCLKCRREFRARSHVSYHTYCNGTKKPYQCNVCDKEFSSISHYQYHVRTHVSPKPYTCDVCGAAFHHRGKLQRHLTSHDVEKKYPCEQCNKAFSNSTALRRHGLLHSGEQPHQCHLCDRKFRDSSNYRKHLQRHGDDLKCLCGSCVSLSGRSRAHRCPRCAHAFHSRKDMRRHMHVHNESKPFRCKVCDRRFRRKDNLERHIRNKHPQHSFATAADCDWDALRERANVTTSAEKANPRSSEKTQLEKLNPLPPIPKDVIESMCDKDKEDQTNTLDKPAIDKSYILEANIARQSVIVVKQPRQENRNNLRHSSPETAYVHKIKKSMTNTKDTSLPPIDTNKLFQFYKHATTEDLDIGAPRPENVQKLKTILMVDEKNKKNKNGDKKEVLQFYKPATTENLDIRAPRPENMQMLKTILMVDEKKTKNMNLEKNKNGDKKEEDKQTPMHWRRKMTLNMNW